MSDIKKYLQMHAKTLIDAVKDPSKLIGIPIHVEGTGIYPGVYGEITTIAPDNHAPEIVFEIALKEDSLLWANYNKEKLTNNIFKTELVSILEDTFNTLKGK